MLERLPFTALTYPQVLTAGAIMALSLAAQAGAETASAQPQAAPTPAVGVETAPAPATPTFDIWEYRVEGNTRLDRTTIEKTVYAYLGPARNLDDVEKARQSLEKAYHDTGYQTVLVDIPEQDVVGGVVKIKVTEGSVERLRITGSRYFSLGRIRESVPELAEGNVPHKPTLDAQLTKLSQSSQDRTITPVFRAGSQPGTLEAELKVKDQLPVHGSVEMNGRDTVGTTYSRLLAMVRYDNLWQLNHSASLQYLVAPESQDVQVWTGTYAMPVFDTGASLAFYGVGIDSKSAVAAAGALGVLGAGNVFGLRVNKPLDPFGNYLHSVTLGWDYKHFTQAILLNNGGPGDNSPITYNPFMFGYSGGLRLEDSLTTFGLEGHFSIRGLGNDQTEFENRRYLAQSNYFYLSGEMRHQHRLPLDLGLLLRSNWQVADGPLISNEQFSSGGMYSVRGYHETQELADSGVIGSVEFSSPRLAPDGWEQVKDLRAAAFLDGGQLWTLNALPGTKNRLSMAGTGLGFRMEMWRLLVGELYWAYPLMRAGNVGPGNQRIHFRLAYEF